MASRRLVLGLGAVGVGGATYYLYTAGGNPKLAEKEFEHDAARLSNKIKSDLPGTAKETKTGIQLSAQEVGSKIDSTLEQAKGTAKDYQKQLQSYGTDAEKKLAEAYEQAKAQGKDYQNQLQGYKSEAEKKLSSAYEQTQARSKEVQGQLQDYRTEAEKKLDEARKETGSRLTKAVDEFDRTVENSAAKAKSSIFSWFGSK